MSNEESDVSISSLRILADELMTTRIAMMRGLGMSYNGRRDLYEACGYPKVLVHQNFYDRFCRGDIGARIVTAYPDACWKVSPSIYDVRDSDTGQSEFEKAVSSLFRRVNMLFYLKKVDILAGLGRYATLFLGFDDTDDLTQPVKNGSKLMYVQAYRETYSMITSLVHDVRDPRYGKPDFYSIVFATGFQSGAGRTSGMGAPNGPGTQNQGSGGVVEGRVHWSRVLHVAEGCIDGDIFGRARMEDVWNRLQDIETIASGSGEMFWRGGFPGTLFSADKDARFTPEDKTMFDESMKDYANGMQRYIRAKGITAQQLTPAIASPLNHIQANLWLISATKGIPYRILTGSEQGELAGSQDTDNWHGRIDARREDWCIPVVLRPLINRLVEVGALPTPKQEEDADKEFIDFKVNWEEAREEDPQVFAATNQSKIATAAAYIAGGVHVLIPRDKFLENMLGVPKEDVEGYLKAGDEFAREQQDQAEKDQLLAQQTAIQMAHAVTAAKQGQPPPKAPGGGMKTQEFHINPDWVEDEDIWVKAKEEAAKTYKEDAENFYAIVTSIYKKMGGKIKSVKQNALQRFLSRFNRSEEQSTELPSMEEVIRNEIEQGVPKMNSCLKPSWEMLTMWEVIEAQVGEPN
jgi:hypothetical protein